MARKSTKQIKAQPKPYPSLGRMLNKLTGEQTSNRILYGFYVLCALLFVADFFYKKKTYFEFENLYGFYPLFAFFLCLALVIVASALRKLLARDAGYYAPSDVETETMPANELQRESLND